MILVGTPGACEATKVKIYDIGPFPAWLKATTVNMYELPLIKLDCVWNVLKEDVEIRKSYGVLPPITPPFQKIV